MGGVLVFCENDDVGYELLNKGAEIAKLTGSDVSVAVIGKDLEHRAEHFIARGAQKVIYSKNCEEALSEFDSSLYAEALLQIAQTVNASVILLGCTRRGKEIAGRLGQKLNAGCINDTIDLELKDGKIICHRYALGGMTVVTQVVNVSTAVISVMPRTFEPAPIGDKSGEVIIVELELKPSRVKVIERLPKTFDSADISEAEVLVCVGKGLASQEDLAMVKELARILGGEVACSKPVATDQHWLSEDRIVGLSGKKCKPQLAICLGISGQVQFMVGIREAKSLIVINNDPNAYILQVSDYGIVGDLHEVVPKLIEGLKH